MTHAMLVAAGAVVLHLASSVGAGQTLTVTHIAADAMKLVAGVVAGALARLRVAPGGRP
jgi:hypothetical protein